MALAQSPAHQELLATAKRVLPGGSNGNVILPPEQAFVIAAGQGTRVYDVEGHCWIDYLLGSGPMSLGHAHPEVVAAVQEQLTKGSTFFLLCVWPGLFVVVTKSSNLKAPSMAAMTMP